MHKIVAQHSMFVGNLFQTAQLAVAIVAAIAV